MLAATRHQPLYTCESDGGSYQVDSIVQGQSKNNGARLAMQTMRNRMEAVSRTVDEKKF